MESAFPNDEDEAAREGTQVHELAYETLRTTHTVPTDRIGSEGSRGLIITADMVEAVRLYVETIGELVGLAFAELPMECPSIHPNCKGTPDAWWVTRDGTEIHVFDLKYGWGIVEPEENPQGICYLSGALDYTLGRGWGNPQVVKFHIVQPRPWHPNGRVRTWTTSPEGLNVHVQKLRASAQLAFTPEPPVISGPQCKRCKAVGVCPAARVATGEVQDRLTCAIPDNMTAEELSRELVVLRAALDVLKPRLDALEAEGMARLKCGGQLPGFRLGRGRSSRTWNIDTASLRAMGEVAGIALVEEKPLTPAQAETAGLPKEIVSSLSRTNEGRLTLVSGDAAEAARKVFANE